MRHLWARWGNVSRRNSTISICKRGVWRVLSPEQSERDLNTPKTGNKEGEGRGLLVFLSVEAGRMLWLPAWRSRTPSGAGWIPAASLGPSHRETGSGTREGAAEGDQPCRASSIPAKENTGSPIPSPQRRGLVFILEAKPAEPGAPS